MKKLYLSSHDKKLTGVCGGIAEYFEIDSTLVRLAWVILSFFPPFPGVIVYIIASMIIPKKNI